MKIIGAMLVFNEDVWIERVLKNVLDFCDHIVIADTGSTDETINIIEGMNSDKIELFHTDHQHTHEIINKYAGGDYWIFGVNGEEIYDPAGLKTLKAKLQSGYYDNFWRVYGMHLHVVKYDPINYEAVGYLAPPSHAPQKLYNFSHLESWNDDYNRTLLLSGGCIFKPEWVSINVCANNSPNSDRKNQDCGWENSIIRCVHMHYTRRSSMDPDETVGLRLSAEDKIGRGSHHDRGDSDITNIRLKYRKGEQHLINVKEFFV